MIRFPHVKKTLVLVVDRDNDFGVKGGVDTPVIGVEECSVAAAALGIADPEDSDINSIYAAINIYRDLINDGARVEVALICGDQKVGYRSDSAIIEELDKVVKEVNPDRIILVGDGAEDEYVYPIISSRIPIDSVRKVVVKQSPGLEGNVYIITKMLEDPVKRKRFMTPIGWILVLITLVYILPMLYFYGMNASNFSRISGSLVILIIGLTLLVYGYNIVGSMSNWYHRWSSSLRSGSVVITFTLISVALVGSGIVLGVLAIQNFYAPTTYQMILRFSAAATWPIIFGMLFFMVGIFINEYLSNGAVRLSFITGSINVLGIGMVIMGAIDLMMSYINIGHKINGIIAIEIVLGIALALTATMIRRYFKTQISRSTVTEA